MTSLADAPGGDTETPGWARSGDDHMKALEQSMSSTCVLIADIRSSRNLEDWTSVFEKLLAVLRAVNSEFADDVVVKFEPTVGDEFQGALRDARNAYAVYLRIKAILPAAIYCGIGIGDVEKPLGRDVGMRGTAFYRAREALELCKDRRRNVIVKSSEQGGLADETLNTLLHFIQFLEDSWTTRQKEVLGYYRLHADHTYEQLGSHFGVSRQSIRDIVSAGDWDLIREGEILVNRWLESV